MPAPAKHVTISDLVRAHTCPVRYYYERDDPFEESDRYAVCKQLSYHLGDPLDGEVIWAEALVVRPDIDPSLREFLDLCITACNKSTWQPAEETDVRVFSEKRGIAGMIDRVAADGSFSIVRAAGAMPAQFTRIRAGPCAARAANRLLRAASGGAASAATAASSSCQ